MTSSITNKVIRNKTSDDHSFSFFLDVDSSGRQSGTASDFEVLFPTRFHIRYFQLISTLIPQTQFNVSIDSHSPDYFAIQYKDDLHTAWLDVPVLPANNAPWDNLSGTELAASLQAKLISLHSAGVDYLDTMIVTFDKPTKKFKFTNTTANIYYSIRVLPSYSVYQKQRVCDMLGFEYIENHVFNATLNSSNQGVIQPSRVARLQHSPYYYISVPEFDTTTHHVGFGSNTIVAAIPCYFNDGQDMVYESLSRTTFRYKLQSAQQLNTLSFRLLDYWGRQVDMKFADWTARWLFQTDSHKDPFTSGDYFYNADLDKL